MPVSKHGESFETGSIINLLIRLRGKKIPQYKFVASAG
jgi:hypothetical protein